MTRASRIKAIPEVATGRHAHRGTTHNQVSDPHASSATMAEPVLGSVRGHFRRPAPL